MTPGYALYGNKKLMHQVFINEVGLILPEEHMLDSYNCVNCMCVK